MLCTTLLVGNVCLYLGFFFKVPLHWDQKDNYSYSFSHSLNRFLPLILCVVARCAIRMVVAFCRMRQVWIIRFGVFRFPPPSAPVRRFFVGFLMMINTTKKRNSWLFFGFARGTFMLFLSSTLSSQFQVQWNLFVNVEKKLTNI